jgi:hypothetical protein
MPRASSDELPTRLASSTLTDMIFTPGAMPLPPTPLAPVAATMPATCVPWPSSSVALWPGAIMFAPWTSSTWPLRSSSTPLPATSAGLVQRLPARSGWSNCTPLSRIATTMPAPWDWVHASAAPVAAGALSAHWSENIGSAAWAGAASAPNASAVMRAARGRVGQQCT